MLLLESTWFTASRRLEKRHNLIGSGDSVACAGTEPRGSRKCSARHRESPTCDFYKVFCFRLLFLRRVSEGDTPPQHVFLWEEAATEEGGGGEEL